MAGHSEWELLRVGWHSAVAALGRAPTRRLVGLWICLLSLAWLLGSIILIQVPSCAFQAKMVKSKQNLHAVQLALERFSVDSPGGVYPADPNVLIETGYLEDMPRNPFTGEPMRWVMLDVLDREAPMPAGLDHGDFGYYPRSEGRYTTEPLDLNVLRETQINGYSLVLY